MAPRITDLFEDSYVGRELRRLMTGLREHWHGAETRRALGRGWHTVTRLSRTATITSLGARVAHWARASVCYRWLTAEPDPEVIVIDLRQTVAIGPVIGTLDRFIEWVAPYWRESTPKRALEELVDVGERAAATQAGQLLGELLAPPAPPESKESAAPGEPPTPRAGDGSSEQADTDTQNNR